jgi:prepilin-type N-terminal cleavage/methylation domain-containing protein
LKRWLDEREDIVRTAAHMKRELSQSEEDRLADLYSERVESWLDKGHGQCHMKDARIADMVASAIKHFDGKRYRLIAWRVMPNHVHVVFEPFGDNQLSKIMHSWKSFTAKEANDILKRAGEFWQPEYFDHLIRNENDLGRSVEYVLGNPQAAGLQNWRWRGGIGSGTGVPPVSSSVGSAPLVCEETHGRDAHATTAHGQDAHTTKTHGRDAHATGFTFIEVLATMSLLAIALPTVMGGIAASMGAAGQARQQAQASSLAYGKMTEIVAQGQWEQSNMAGDFGTDYPDFRWTAQVSEWDGSAVEQLDVTVLWRYRQKNHSVTVSTLVNTGGTQ